MRDIPLQKAFSVLDIKAADATGRTFSGVATSPVPDRVGDVIDPKGVKFAKELPLLLYHDSKKPVGEARLRKATDAGIQFDAIISTIDRPGVVKERLDEAIDSLNATPPLIRGVSIGFRPLVDPVFIKETGGFRYPSVEVMELSMVVIPAHQEATIQVVKSIDAQHLAASGQGDEPTHVGTPAVAGSVVRLAKKDAPTIMKNYSERKASRVAEKAAKVAKLNELMGLDDGTTLDQENQDQFDTLVREIKALEDELARIETLEQVNKESAVPVAGDSVQAASASRSGAPVVTVRETLPKGIGFARAIKARYVARTDGRNVLDVAKSMYPSDDRLHAHLSFQDNLPNILSQIKAAVPAATTTQATWASALVDPTNLANEFIEFLRPETILGKLNLRSIPFNVRIIEQTQGGTGYWVGQGAPKPLTSFGFAPITLGYTKVAAIAVATQESLRFSSPDLDNIIRMSLRDALVERIDRDLLDPAEAGTSNVQPASLTYGLTPLSSAGTSADNIRTDLARLVNAFRAANLRGRIALVLPESLAVTASLMTNSLGQPEFPELTADGGSIRGLRVITSNYVANASGAGNMVVAIAESEVFLADDGQVSVNVSTEASLQMLDNPTNNSATATPTTMVSMFQTNSVAFLAERFINWAKRRSDAVVYMDDVNWGSAGSPS